MNSNKPIRVAVIGCGYWGPNLMRNFSKIKDCQLVAVSDLDEERLARAKKMYPHLKIFKDCKKILRSPDIDAVAIATPVATHYKLVKEALKAGKHVLSEKPLVNNYVQARELVDLAKTKGKVLMVDSTFLYSGQVTALKGIIDRGELGEFFYLDSIRANLGRLSKDVNVLWDLAPHDFSIMNYLLDKKAKAISAIGSAPIDYSDRKLESIVHIAVQFEDGAIASIHLSWLSPLKERRMIIGGSKKMAVYDHFNQEAPIKVFDKGVRLEKREKPPGKFAIEYHAGETSIPTISVIEPLENMCNHFIDCIRNNKPPLSSGEAEAKTVQLLEAAQNSLDQGGKRINL